MDYDSIKDKKIALIINNSEKENDTHVYLGRIIKDKICLFFINDIKKWKISLDSENLERLTEIPDDLKGILLGADYYFTFSISTIPDDTSNEDYVFTGMKWH